MTAAEATRPTANLARTLQLREKAAEFIRLEDEGSEELELAWAFLARFCNPNPLRHYL